MGKLLGIDYGDRRVGIAVSDEDRTHAFARTAIQNNSRIALIDALKKLIAEEKIDRIIAGLPISMNGQEGPQATAVRTAMTDICRELNIPLEFEDERLSSSFADRFKESSHDQDSIAAATILESYLERTRQTL
jgi:putative holliday junction resolvase